MKQINQPQRCPLHDTTKCTIIFFRKKRTVSVDDANKREAGDDLQKRIEELARGQYHYDMPNIECSTDKLEMNVLLGHRYVGEITIRSSNQVPMEGMIYSSSGRMVCKTTRFEGLQAKIQYEFYSEGLKEGDIHKGEIYLISNGGEYNLSFVAYISKDYKESSIGPLRHLHDVVKLAQENFSEASQFFPTAACRELLKAEEPKAALLYRGLNKGTNHKRMLEEYLCAMKKKQPVVFQVLDGKREFQELQDKVREVLQIKKDTWGYIEIQVTCDADFVSFSRNSFDTEDFVGGILNIPYAIEPKRLHAGHNYAKIVVASRLQQEEIRLHIMMPSGRVRDRELHLQVQHLQEKLTQLYMDYRFQKIVTGVWCKESVKLLDQLVSLTGEERYKLMKAQTYVINHQRQEAEWILDEFKRRHFKETNTVEWAYYLYLSTLNEREVSYVNELTEQIEEIYEDLDHPQMIFWMLLFLRGEYYENHGAKLRALQQELTGRTGSPFFYMEAFYIYQEEPYLMHELGDFEKNILLWGMKHKGITKDMYDQLRRLLRKERSFDEKVYRILCKSYEQFQEEEILEELCNYLIRFGKYSEECKRWYALAIEKELRVTNLYEAYMNSLDKRTRERIPKEVFLYFQYNNTLTFTRKALLYRQVIEQKREEPELYEHYCEIMETFAFHQMEQKHIDDNLAVLYDDVLSQGGCNAEIAAKIAELLYTCRLSNVPQHIRYVVVVQYKWKTMQVVPVVNHTAYFNVFSKDYCIILEEEDGSRTTDLGECQMEKLMHPAHYIRKCVELAPEQIPYLLHYFDVSPVEKAVNTQRTIQLRTLMQSTLISHEYRKELYQSLIRYCYQEKLYEQAEPYLTQEIFTLLEPNESVMAVEMLIELRKYEEAYQKIPQGSMHLEKNRQLALCTNLITQHEYKKEENLLCLSAHTFRRGAYNEVLLRYLVQYYDGPTSHMAAIFQAANEHHVDTAELEERLLVQMLFTTEFVECTDAIYEKFRERGGEEQIRAAYLSYYAYCSFVKKMLVSDHVFDELLQRFREHTLNQMEKLALLQWLSQKPELKKEERHISETLLGECMREGLRFKFYKQFPQEIQQEFYLYDKMFVEYRTKPGRHVILCYKSESDGVDDYREEEMQEMYEGIYVKSFVLFYGDKIQYYIKEEMDGICDITASNAIQNNESHSENEDSRYDMLNDMSVAMNMEDGQTLLHMMKKYKMRESMVNDCFYIL